jgi:type I restriction enzyme, R subunit
MVGTEKRQQLVAQDILTHFDDRQAAMAGKGLIVCMSRRNVVQSRTFSVMMESTISRYQSRTIESAQVIQELIELAKEMRAANQRGEDLGLAEDELAFYDALKVNDSAVQVLGDETLKAIARELVAAVRRNVSIDWTERETVIQQAETLCKDWALTS